MSLAFHVTVTIGSAPARARSATRGAISPLMRASLSLALTRTGVANLSPPSRLTAIMTSPFPAAAGLPGDGDELAVSRDPRRGVGSAGDGKY